MEEKINSQLMRLVGVRETEEKKTITIALVSTIVDSYETIIDPSGLLSPVESVPVDYNHNRISTGAKMRDLGVKKDAITIPNGEGGEKKVDARMVEVDIFKDSRMWTKENKEQRAELVPSLFDAVESGRVAWGSVDFEPLRDQIEMVYDQAGKLLRQVFKKWRLNFFSLLDTKPGQDTSYVLSVRMKEESDMSEEKTVDEVVEDPQVEQEEDAADSEERDARPLTVDDVRKIVREILEGMEKRSDEDLDDVDEDVDEDEDADEDEDGDEAEAEIVRLKKENEDLKEKYQRLSASPERAKAQDSDAATDLGGERAKDEAPKTRAASAGSKARFGL